MCNQSWQCSRLTVSPLLRNRASGLLARSLSQSRRPVDWRHWEPHAPDRRVAQVQAHSLVKARDFHALKYPHGCAVTVEREKILPKHPPGIVQVGGSNTAAEAQGRSLPAAHELEPITRQHSITLTIPN